MRDYDFSPLFRQLIGFDDLENSMKIEQEEIQFPQYDIKKYDDNHYRIVLALAGFKKEKISIELEGPRLTIKGKPSFSNKQTQYLHKGLIYKEFSLIFTLAEHMTVKKAELNLGLLNIDLERNIPEFLQPRKIDISCRGETSKINNYK